MEELQYNVIIYDINAKKFFSYDVLPYFAKEYKELTKKKKQLLSTFDEFKEFIISNARYRFQSRCEYEILLQSWPGQDVCIKTDVYEQIKMNIDIVTRTFMEYVKVTK